jgi:L-amino acid N-acyltransferase YncA
MIRIRRAGPDDRDAVLLWRNDPETRRASLTHDEVPDDDHAAWFASSLEDELRRLYIGEVEGEPIGVVRFDIGQESSEVSINLAPQYRGRRLSRPLLEAAIAAYEQERGEPQQLVAMIRTDNPASSRIFRSLGFGGAPGQGDVERLVRRAG